MDAGKLLLMQLAENEQREGLSEADRSKAYEELSRLYPSWSLKELAAAVNKDASLITRYLSVSKVIPTVRDAFDAGQIGITDVYAISRAAKGVQAELLRMKLHEGATRDQLEKSVRKARPKGADSVSASSVTIPLPSGAKITIKGRRMNLAEVIECIEQCLTSAKRAARDRVGVKAWALAMADRSKEAASAM